MKNNLYYLFIFIILLSCYSKKDEILVDIESFKKQGKEIYLVNNINNSINEIKKIKKFLNYPSFDLKEWKHENYQNSNFIPHVVFLGSFDKKKNAKFFYPIKKNIYEKNVIVFDNKIYYVDDLSNIYILDYNLRLINKFTIYNKKYFQDYLLKFSLTSDGKNLYISDNLGNLHAYNPKLNKIIWTNKLGVPFVSNLVLYKNNLYVVNDNGKIYSFDSESGNQNWSYESATNIIKNNNSFQIVADFDKVIFSNDLGDLYCIDLVQKNLIWSLNIENNSNLTNNNLLELSKIILKDDDIFFSTNQNKIFYIDAKTGKINWVIDLPSESTITSLVVDKHIINITKNGFFSIINKSDGAILYRVDILSKFSNLKKNEQEFFFKYSFIASNYIYFVTTNGFFFKVNSNDLDDIKYIKTSKNISSFPIIISKNIYFLDRDGVINKFN